MSILKNLWKKVVKNTSTAPTLSIVDTIDDTPDCKASELLECVLEADEASPWFLKLGAPALFEEWYKGDLTEVAVRASLPEFLQLHPQIASRVGDLYK